MWLNALRFVTCKVIVDAFSLLYSKLLLTKLSLFGFCAIFADSHGQFISICSYLIRNLCLSVIELEWIVRETQKLLIALGRRFES